MANGGYPLGNGRDCGRDFRWEVELFERENGGFGLVVHPREPLNGTDPGGLGGVTIKEDYDGDDAGTVGIEVIAGREGRDKAEH